MSWFPIPRFAPEESWRLNDQKQRADNGEDEKRYGVGNGRDFRIFTNNEDCLRLSHLGGLL